MSFARLGRSSTGAPARCVSADSRVGPLAGLLGEAVPRPARVREVVRGAALRAPLELVGGGGALRRVAAEGERRAAVPELLFIREYGVDPLGVLLVVGPHLEEAAGRGTDCELADEGWLEEAPAVVALLRPRVREVDPEAGDARGRERRHRGLRARLHQAHVLELGLRQPARQLEDALHRALDAEIGALGAAPRKILQELSTPEAHVDHQRERARERRRVEPVGSEIAEDLDRDAPVRSRDVGAQAPGHPAYPISKRPGSRRRSERRPGKGATRGWSSTTTRSPGASPARRRTSASASSGPPIASTRPSSRARTPLHTRPCATFSTCSTGSFRPSATRSTKVP